MAPMIYEARDSFSTEDPDGSRVHVYKGDTVREGHWLLEAARDAFQPLTVRFEVQTAKGTTPPAPTPAAIATATAAAAPAA